MRRRFNAALCPKAPPEKTERLKGWIGSPFNQWYRASLEQFGIDYQAFAERAGISVHTCYSWRFKNDPRVNSWHEIAKGFESFGLGEYTEIRDKIRRLVYAKRI